MGDHLATNRHRPKRGRLLCPFREEVAASPSNAVWPGPSSTSIPSGILIHRAVWPQETWAKIGGVPPFGGNLGPRATQCGQGWGLLPLQVSTWSIQPFGHNTPMSQTGHTDNGSIAQGKPFYKRSPKKRNMWQITCSPRPPTLSQSHMDLHVCSYPRHSYIFQVSLKSVQEFIVPGGSKFAHSHYSGYWLLQQLCTTVQAVMYLFGHRCKNVFTFIILVTFFTF